MADIICPSCNSKSYFSLKQETYKGPFRCTDCKALFNIVIENDVVKSVQPLDQAGINKLGPLHNPYIGDPKDKK